MRYAYPCNLEPELDPNPKFRGFLNVSFPDVPGALTCGKGRKEALLMAEDALTIMLGVYVERNEDIPVPGPLAAGQELVPVSPLGAVKLALYTAMRRKEISKAELAQNLGISETAVKQMLMPDRYSHMKQLALALDAVGCRLAVEELAA